MLSTGMRLGDRYRLEARIGSGGMGEVWRAVDEVLSRPVAVKVMLARVADDPDFARRFLAEATAMARVNHPAVASIHDYGRSHDVTFLVMELVEGRSLAQLLARDGRLGPQDTMRLIAQAADGLQAVHDCGIVHRDIKPANLLVRPDGSVVITDFGIARRDDASRLTASGAILGTPSYLSPEQVLGQPVTVRSDVYSLGLTAYECLAGAPPFVGDNPYAVALQRLQAAPRTIGVTLSAGVRAVVERALATDPADRWPTAAALADAARDVGGAPPGRPSAAPGAPGNAGASAAGRRPAVAAPGSLPPSPVAPGSLPPSPVAPGSLPPSPVAPGSSPSPVAARSKRRRRSLLAALAALLLIGGGVAWIANRDTGGSRNPGAANGNASPGIGSPGRPSAAPVEVALRRAGFTPCGKAFCPAEPICWGGLTSISGRAMPPQQVDCAASHYWETFAVIELPAGAADADPNALIRRKDVAAACSATAMASSSHHPDATRSWHRDAWPIQLSPSGIWLVHCLARPPAAEATGSAF